MVGQSAHELWREFNPVNSSKAQLILAKEIGFVHSANAAPKRAQDHEVWHQADKPLSDAFNRCSLILYLVTIHSQFMYICSHNSLTIHSHVFIYASAFTIRYVKVCILAFPMVSASIAGWDLWLGIVGLGSLAWDLWHWISCLDSFP